MGYKEGIQEDRRQRGKWVEGPTLSKKGPPEKVNFEMPGTRLTLVCSKN